MLFNSIQFMFFFPAVVGLYFLCPQRFRWLLLLLASYLFYAAWEPGYLILIMASTLVDYTAGRAMAHTDVAAGRRRWLVLSLVSNLGLLGFFKYYNFFADSLKPLLHGLGQQLELPHSEFLLPVGISFYTFQTLSYTIEVYRGNKEAERHLGYFALYVAFFPQLVAGPIERAQNLLPQLKQHYDFDYDRVSYGLKRMLWGFFKKVVIADRLAIVVNHVYGSTEMQSGPTVTVATLFFAFQIYCDFSGYSDIAIGAARIMGIRLMENFDRPYAATSFTDFWRRWHISLSTWFRDYLYIPLGGNRSTAKRWCINILLVFLLSGLWHGAKWTFVIWGLFHAVALLGERFLSKALPSMRVPKVISVSVTFLLVCVGWIFFRAQSIEQAWAILLTIPTGWSMVLDGSWLNYLGLFPHEIPFVFLAIPLLELVQWFQSRAGAYACFMQKPQWVRWAAYSLVLWGIFLFGVLKQTEFYYFVF